MVVRHEVARYEWYENAQGSTFPCPPVRESLTPPAVAVSNEPAVSRARKVSLPSFIGRMIERNDWMG